MNAGFIPPEHWVHDPEAGGGRLLGEVCHFVDFLCYMCGSEVARISAVGIGGSTGKYRDDDNLALTVKFQDGSVGQILYTARAPSLFPGSALRSFVRSPSASSRTFGWPPSSRAARPGKSRNCPWTWAIRPNCRLFSRAQDDPARFGRDVPELCQLHPGNLEGSIIPEDRGADPVTGL